MIAARVGYGVRAMGGLLRLCVFIMVFGSAIMFVLSSGVPYSPGSRLGVILMPPAALCAFLLAIGWVAAGFRSR